MKVKLGDVATYINGYAFKPSDWSNNGRPIIRIQDLTGNSYQMNRYNGVCDEKYIVREGDILISWSASLGVYVWHGEEAVLNQHIFKVVFDKKEVNESFFVHQVSRILENASSAAHGATMKHLTKPVFDALPFYLPSIKEQEEIAFILDEICGIIKKKEQQLQKLDELVKARFVEMFGDPASKNRPWQHSMMKMVCTRITDGEHGSVPRTANGHVFLNAKHIQKSGSIDWATVSYIDDDVHQKIYKRCNPEPGDILMTTTGTIGNIAIVPDVLPFSMDRGITLLKIDPKIINPSFLAWLLRFDSIQKIMTANVHASAIGHLFLNKVEQLPVIVPPLTMQQQFASFVSQVDKSKAVIKTALKRTQLLLDSKIQQYFDE